MKGVRHGTVRYGAGSNRKEMLSARLPLLLWTLVHRFAQEKEVSPAHHVRAVLPAWHVCGSRSPTIDEGNRPEPLLR